MTIDPNDISLFGVKGMNYGAKPPIPMPKREITMTEKLVISHWQLNEIEDILASTMKAEEAEQWVEDHLERRPIPNRVDDVSTVYIFFGYEKDARRWLIDNNIPARDVVIARDWKKLEGRRGIPKIVYGEDKSWFRINRHHEIVQNAREQIYRLEAMFGTAE